MEMGLFLRFKKTLGLSMNYEIEFLAVENEERSRKFLYLLEGTY